MTPIASIDAPAIAAKVMPPSEIGIHPIVRNGVIAAIPAAIKTRARLGFIEKLGALIEFLESQISSVTPAPTSSDIMMAEK